MSGASFLVERQRVVLPDDANLFRAVCLLDLLQGGVDARAERALEVTDFHDRNQRVLIAPRRILGSHWDWAGAVITSASSRRRRFLVSAHADVLLASLNAKHNQDA